jgi:hypothetical protein
MTSSKNFVCNTFILMFVFFAIATFTPCSGAQDLVRVSSDQGEIKVYNGAKFPVHIYISDQSMGRLGSGDSNSWYVNYGTHRVEARWRGGNSTSTTLTISKSNAYASWYISEEETY